LYCVDGRQVQGDLSERARQRASELARDADLRKSPPKVASESTATRLQLAADDRLSVPGTIIVRKYKGEMLAVNVLPSDFDFKGDVFKSLVTTLTPVQRKILRLLGLKPDDYGH